MAGSLRTGQGQAPDIAQEWASERKPMAVEAGPLRATLLGIRHSSTISIGLHTLLVQAFVPPWGCEFVSSGSQTLRGYALVHFELVSRLLCAIRGCASSCAL